MPLVRLLLQVIPVARERGGFSLRARALHVYEEALRVRRFSRLCYGVGLRTGSLGSNLDATIDEQVSSPDPPRPLTPLPPPLNAACVAPKTSLCTLANAHPTVHCVSARPSSRVWLPPTALALLEPPPPPPSPPLHPWRCFVALPKGGDSTAAAEADKDDADRVPGE